MKTALRRGPTPPPPLSVVEAPNVLGKTTRIGSEESHADVLTDCALSNGFRKLRRQTLRPNTTQLPVNAGLVSNIAISMFTSAGSRRQFSVEKAYTVSHGEPFTPVLYTV